MKVFIYHTCRVDDEPVEEKADSVVSTATFIDYSEEPKPKPDSSRSMDVSLC